MNVTVRKDNESRARHQGRHFPHAEISQMTDAKPSRTITSRENIRNEPRTHTGCINPWARAGLLRLVLRQSIAIPSGSPVSLRTPPSTRLDSLSVLSLYRFYPETSRGENNPRPRIRSSAVCIGVQPRQLPASASAAGGGKPLVVDDASRQADQDRREGRAACPVCDVPDG